MINEDGFVDFDTAVFYNNIGAKFVDLAYYIIKTKELVFDKPDDDHIIAPNFFQLYFWLKKKHNFVGYVMTDLSNNLEDEVYVFVVDRCYGDVCERSDEYKEYIDAHNGLINFFTEKLKNYLDYGK